MRTLIAVAMAVLALAPYPLLAPAQTQYPDVIYVPTPQEGVEDMLRLANVGKNDVLYDLGSGDGRIAITAAQKFGIRAVGIDIDPERIDEARVNARKAGVGDRVQFRVGDLFESDFSAATVVTLYLLPVINQRLRPQLWRQLAVGTRVVSHEFDMGVPWPAERVEYVGSRRVLAWTIKPEHKKA